MEYEVCPSCGRKFEKQRWNQKYCVTNCKNKYWNRKSKRLPVGLTDEQMKQVEAIIAKKRLRDTDSEPLDAI